MVRKVLFVDDDEILRMAVERSFASFGESFTLITAKDGFDAVKTLKSVSVSLVVLDLVMPRMDGMSLLGHIREHFPDLPVIVISSMPGEEMREVTGKLGVEEYFSKPFLADELAAAIRRLLQREAEGGVMHDVSPTVFLQLMEMDGKSCTIRIFDKNSGEGGVLYFLDGQLLDARIGTLKGREAAGRVFGWDLATIYINNSCQSRENVINSGLQPIIMEALTLKDEAEGDEATAQTGEPVAALADVAPVATDPLAAWNGKLEGIARVKTVGSPDQAILEMLESIGNALELGSFQAGVVDRTHLLIGGKQPVQLELELLGEQEQLMGRLRRMGGEKAA